MVPRRRRGRLAGRALSHPFVLRGQNIGGHVAPHGGRAAPLAAGARLIAAPTPRRRHLTQRGASRRRRQNRREPAARPRQQKHQNVYFSFSSRLVSSCRRRTRARRALVSPRSLREGRFEPGASRRSGGTRRQNARRSPHGDAAALAADFLLSGAEARGRRRRRRTTSTTWPSPVVA